ncbi:MAG: hypothetical protein ACTHME_03240, partial [Candidatus Nitrosocosmicus sp.]
DQHNKMTEAFFLIFNNNTNINYSDKLMKKMMAKIHKYNLLLRLIKYYKGSIVKIIGHDFRINVEDRKFSKIK